MGCIPTKQVQYKSVAPDETPGFFDWLTKQELHIDMYQGVVNAEMFIDMYKLDERNF